MEKIKHVRVQRGQSLEPKTARVPTVFFHEVAQNGGIKGH